MLVEAHSYEVHDVSVVEFTHYEGLHEEVHLGLIGAELRQRLDGYSHVHGVAGVLLVEALVHLAESTLAEGSGENEK